MTSNLTTHATRDRLARLNYIIDTVGVGKVMCEGIFDDPRPNYPQTTRQLTSTGVIIIKNSKNQVVTAFIATMSQAIQVWEKAHGRNAKMMAVLVKQVKKNECYRANQPC